MVHRILYGKPDGYKIAIKTVSSDVITSIMQRIINFLKWESNKLQTR